MEKEIKEAIEIVLKSSEDNATNMEMFEDDKEVEQAMQEIIRANIKVRLWLESK
jgi:hypothetical protein